jgi:hypothetical protein
MDRRDYESRGSGNGRGSSGVEPSTGIAAVVCAVGITHGSFVGSEGLLAVHHDPTYTQHQFNAVRGWSGSHLSI